jgi:hypothetical protein
MVGCMVSYRQTWYWRSSWQFYFQIHRHQDERDTLGLTWASSPPPPPRQIMFLLILWEFYFIVPYFTALLCTPSCPCKPWTIPQTTTAKDPSPICGFFLFVLFCFWDRVFLCSPGCPGTHDVDHTGLELRNPPASASWVLRLKACTTTGAWLNSQWPVP